MKKLYLTIFLFSIWQLTFAQTVDDALLLSRYNYNTTARASSMGGAFGAVGGDFSSLSINPAGIALYRNSEFTLTPSFEINKANGKDESRFLVNNIGCVISFMPRIAKENEWLGINFGFGINHIANFYRKSFLFNPKSQSSRLDAWANYANGNKPADLYPFEEKLAYDNYLINPKSDSISYVTVLDGRDLMDQEQEKREKGYINEFVLSIGANYSHKLYIGATIGIQDVYYKASTSYSEFALKDNISSLNNFTFKEYRRITGFGANLKLGVIYKATQNLRLGLSIHTPTYYHLNNTMETFLRSNFDQNIPHGFPKDGKADHAFLSEFIEYVDSDFRNPARAILSGAYVFGKRAIVSFDYEYIDYSTSKNKKGETELDDGKQVFVSKRDFSGVNKSIKKTYQNTANLRIGGEFRVTPQFSIRGGYTHIGDPFKGDYDEDYKIYSGGFGYHIKNFFVDASYQHTDYSENLTFYQNSDVVKLKNKRQQYKITFGLKF